VIGHRKVVLNKGWYSEVVEFPWIREVVHRRHHSVSLGKRASASKKQKKPLMVASILVFVTLTVSSF
jgi:hypothetical protein